MAHARVSFGGHGKRLLGGGLALLGIALGTGVEITRERRNAEAELARWVHAEALPFGGVMVEPHWTLELAAVLDNPHALQTTIDELRRRRGVLTVEALRLRFALVQDEAGMHFDSPLMTTPEDTEGVRALAHFAAVAHDTLRGDSGAAAPDLAGLGIP